MSCPGWAILVSSAFGTLVFLATLTHLVMWWGRKSAGKYTEEWDTIMARCGRGEQVGELLSPSEQVLRAECTCDDVGTMTTLQRINCGSNISFAASETVLSK